MEEKLKGVPCEKQHSRTCVGITFIYIDGAVFEQFRLKVEMKLLNYYCQNDKVSRIRTYWAFSKVQRNIRINCLTDF